MKHFDIRVRKVAAAGVAVALAGAALATPADASSRVTPARGKQVATIAHALGGKKANTQAAAIRYWTPARMRSATLLDLKVARKLKVAPLKATGPAGRTPIAAPGKPRSAARHSGVAASSTVGRVFFYNPKASDLVSVGNKSCSASALNSPSKQLVITAGHCVNGGENGTWYQNWIFVPRYKNGAQPFGAFAAKQFATFSSWASDSDLSRDVGMATTWPNAHGKVVNVVGGNGLAWNGSLAKPITILGYPAEAPYDGAWQHYCTGTTYGEVFDQRYHLDCGFTGGSSGSPWLLYYNGTTGYVASDMSTLDSSGTNAAPYYDNAVKTMYDHRGSVT